MTGGAGFLGVPTIRALGEAGYEVICLDDFRLGTRARLEALSDVRLHVEEADIRDGEALRKVIDAYEPWGVVHLAALHFIPYCVANPEETVSVNVLGTQTVLSAIENSSVRRLIFASTADAYRPSMEPHAEMHSLEPLNIYGASKVMGEWLVRLHARRNPSLDVRVARLFNLYGPGETNPHVLPDILDGMRQGNALSLGALSPRRDYVFVHDAARALCQLLTTDTPFDVVNVGTGSSTSVSELVEELRTLTNRPLEVSQDPAKLRAVDRPEMRADTSLLRRLIPQLEMRPLRDGLELTLVDAGLWAESLGDRT